MTNRLVLISFSSLGTRLAINFTEGAYYFAAQLLLHPWTLELTHPWTKLTFRISDLFIFFSALADYYSNKTIKDGDIAPWLFWNNLSTWPHGKIWTERKEKNTEKDWTIEMERMVERFLFFPAALHAFGAQVVCLHHVFFPMLQASLTILESWTILDHFRPFRNISDHHGPFYTILDRITLNNIGPWQNILTILDHFLKFSVRFLAIFPWPSP